jgi:hypothetical protein
VVESKIGFVLKPKIIKATSPNPSLPPGVSRAGRRGESYSRFFLLNSRLIDKA